MATALSLSLTELARLEALQTILLTPFDYRSVDHWRAAANAGARELLQGGVAAFALPPVPGRAMCFSDELSPEARAVFDAVFLNDAARERALVNRLVVWNQTAIIAGDWDVYHRDPVVNEFLKPNGLLDAVGFMLEWAGKQAYATLAVYRDRYGTEIMGERGVQLLRILLPAFKAGTRTVLQMAERQRALAGALDALGQALQVRSPDGRVLNETTSLGRILAGDHESQLLRDELASAAQAGCAPLSPRPKARSHILRDSPYRNVRTATAWYRIWAVALTGGVVDLGRVVLTGLERATSTPVAEAELRARYRLTPREVEVARLMATGISNTEIARRLSTSVHTTRRQSERVLAKLGIHRRAEVGAKLQTP
jgi:DNA-binding CsgD family transcriptional regulator